MANKYIYKVVFLNNNEVYELYAKNVYEGDMDGFMVVEDFIFDEKSTIVVDPSVDKLRAQFQGVKCSFIPMHEIIRIDQIKKPGVAKITASKKPVQIAGNVSSLYAPEKK